jgi:hypothetical protein
MGRGVDIPWIEEIDIPWVGGLIYHGQCGQNTMGRGSIYHVLGVKITWVGESIYHE